MRGRIALVILISALALLPCAPAVQAAPAVPYRITFINVGQGDAALLVDSSGFAVLVDGGAPSAGPGLVSYLRGAGISDIDVMVATHPDSDHIGGLLDVLAMTDLPVLSVVYNGYPGTTQTWANFTAAVAAEGLSLTTVTIPQALPWGAMTAEVINPPGGLSNPDTNDACLAFRVITGTVKTLFTCDLDSAQEGVILARGAAVDSEILKVAHHGSGGSTSAVFLAAVTPLEVVISVGDNSYGHPSAETIARLEDAGARVWRTDLDGHVTILTDGTAYTVNAPFNAPRKLFLPLAVAGIDAPPAPALVIGTIFYDGVQGSAEPDEYVEIINQGTGAAQLQGYTLSDNQSHVFTFPSFLMQPGQACRVYTNESHPETCGFSYASGTSIWNNTGDCAALKTPQGVVVNTKCYP